jgi:hypothetical protein
MPGSLVPPPVKAPHSPQYHRDYCRQAHICPGLGDFLNSKARLFQQRDHVVQATFIAKTAKDDRYSARMRWLA